MRISKCKPRNEVAASKQGSLDFCQTLKVEAVQSSETSVDFYQATKHRSK
jgi:hypothetical protein